MATEVIKTVKSSGGDYTSVAAFEAGEQRDLKVADEIAIAECYAFQDTTAVTISGWTTDATRYIKIYTPTSERHPGYWDDTKYRLEVASGIALVPGVQDIVIDGLQIYSGDNIAIYSGVLALSINHTFSRNIIKGNNVINTYGIFVGTGCLAGSKAYIYNNIVYDHTGGSNAGIVFRENNLTVWVFNNTVVNCPIGIFMTVFATHYIKNNIVNCTNAFLGSFTDNDTYNDYNTSSENLDDVALGSHGRYNQSFTYVNAGIDDFHLDPADGGAVGFGVDLSGDANLPILTDIDGDSTVGLASWNMGADQFPVSGNVGALLNGGLLYGKAFRRLVA